MEEDQAVGWDVADWRGQALDQPLYRALKISAGAAIGQMELQPLNSESKT
jgi:hypothetical protein